MWEGEVLHYQLMTVHEVKLASICLGGKTVIFSLISVKLLDPTADDENS